MKKSTIKEYILELGGEEALQEYKQTCVWISEDQEGYTLSELEDYTKRFISDLEEQVSKKLVSTNNDKIG